MRAALLGFIFLLQIISAQSQTLEDFMRTVVFLRHDVIETNTGRVQSYKSGSGLLILQNGHPYLATAKHVAAELAFTTNDWVVTALDNRKSTNPSRNKWCDMASS
jgi:hypothetical protein